MTMLMDHNRQYFKGRSNGKYNFVAVRAMTLLNFLLTSVLNGVYCQLCVPVALPWGKNRMFHYGGDC